MMSNTEIYYLACRIECGVKGYSHGAIATGFFMTTNGLYGIQCKCLLGANVTVKPQ